VTALAELPTRRLLSYPEAAAYLGVPVGTLRSMVSRRQVAHVRLSARVVKFDLADLDAMIAARRVPAGGAPDNAVPELGRPAGGG
jgi:excisionase family DNA binding protein